MEVEELLALAGEEGLAGRHASLCGLARRAIRITPTVDGNAGAARLCSEIMGSGDGAEWMRIADLDLSHPALDASPLTTDGRLIVFIPAPARRDDRECLPARVEVSHRAQAIEAAGLACDLSAELTLPRVWAAAVQALDLDEAEHDGYVRLRERIAELQGVTALGAGGHGVADHRLLGYPTETSGSMPRLCEMAARGLDPGEPVADVTEDAAAASERWRLLLQVTNDPRAGISLGEDVERAYIWIAQEDLVAQDLSRVWVILR